MVMGTEGDPVIVASERDEHGVTEFVDVYPDSL